MKAILQYTNSLDDKRWFYGILVASNIHVIKEKRGPSIYPRVTICIKDYVELNEIVKELNEKCCYGVSIVKVFEKSFLEKLFGL